MKEPKGRQVPVVGTGFRLATLKIPRGYRCPTFFLPLAENAHDTGGFFRRWSPSKVRFVCRFDISRHHSSCPGAYRHKVKIFAEKATERPKFNNTSPITTYIISTGKEFTHLLKQRPNAGTWERKTQWRRKRKSLFTLGYGPTLFDTCDVMTILGNMKNRLVATW